MNKMIRTGLLILLAVSLMLTTALAGEVIISEREKASRLADKAMEEKYGITLLTQEYFNRNTADEGNGRFVVQYWGIEDWGFVLGNYKVVVDNGKVTEITWSHDGEDTSGGMNADAWGNEQILEMLLMNQESGETSQFDEKIQEINQKHGITDFSELFEVPEDERIWDEIGYKNVREQAALSVEEMTRIAMEGIRHEIEIGLRSVRIHIDREQCIHLHIRFVDMVPILERSVVHPPMAGPAMVGNYVHYDLYSLIVSL